MRHQRGQDSARAAPHLGVALADVRIGVAAGEERDCKLYDRSEGQRAAGQDAQSQLPVPLACESKEPEAGSDERHLLLDEERDDQGKQEPTSPASFEEVEGEAQRRHREGYLVKVEEVDVGQWDEQEIDRNP